MLRLWMLSTKKALLSCEDTIRNTICTTLRIRSGGQGARTELISLYLYMTPILPSKMLTNPTKD
uniref:Putative ovule protein n=1 Tax=Solanum chacoense TaxID=4108 RepID=A0A0V0GW94_SOLCH